MDLQRVSESFGASDWTHLASQHGLQAAHTVTIDAAELVEAFHYPDGYLKAGILLGKITASGLYRPYTSNETDGSETAVCMVRNEVPIRHASDGTLLATTIAVSAVWEAQVYVAKMPGGVLANGTTAAPIVVADLPAGIIDVTA